MVGISICSIARRARSTAEMYFDASVMACESVKWTAAN